MPSELDVLLDRVGDAALRADIRAQVERLRAKRTFGLVFESHLPERVRLPEHPVRVGVNVVHRDDPGSPTFEVVSVTKRAAIIRKVRNPAGGVLSDKDVTEQTDEKAPLDSLVVIADFGEPIFPGLRDLGSIDRGGDKPAHIVIKGENHHVLEALQFTHAGKFDCIYIDPPYNTGARDWKYDNNYVDDNDAYRHSKWLAFMERRLALAKRLLNAEDSVLIVTIDEKEYLRLGLLLEQIFPSARIQVVSVGINPAAVARKGFFGRSDEYYFFVMIGEAGARPVRLGPEWITTRGRTHRGQIRWDLLRKSGSSPQRAGHPGTFYPIFVKSDGSAIHSIGEPVEPVDAPRSSVKTPEGAVAVWPIRRNGTEGRWRISPEMARRVWQEGCLRLGEFNGGNTPVYYLAEGERKKILSGEYDVMAHAPDGSVVTSTLETLDRVMVPGTQWHIPGHDATQYGTRLLGSFLPDRQFPFPKSLYAVEDALRFFIGDKPDALVLDFFGGSGTTVHAVARLNRQDGGRRQTVLVTNNEVSADEAEGLRKRGRQPGDPEWETLGIFEHITRPRVTAAITGCTPSGEPVRGDYKFTDEFPMAEGFEENVRFFELTYLNAEDVEIDAAFAGIAPLLWARAGGRGAIIGECLDSGGRRKPYASTQRYGVLFNPDRWRSFVEKLSATATTVFIVTDSQTTFSGIAAELPDSIDVVRLYENYLSTFAINRGTA